MNDIQVKRKKTYDISELKLGIDIIQEINKHGQEIKPSNCNCYDGTCIICVQRRNRSKPSTSADQRPGRKSRGIH